LAFFFQTTLNIFPPPGQSSRHHSFEKDFSKGKVSSIYAIVHFVEKLSEKAKGNWQTQGIMI
jgi:hypothetical protein